jgi:hypothetical protein
LDTLDPARYSGPFGTLELRAGDSFVSNVIDSGGYRQKKLTITFDAAIGSGSILYRYSNDQFSQDDVSPDWEYYYGYVPVIDYFRYYQIRVDG